jgi:hypothetical protein
MYAYVCMYVYVCMQYMYACMELLTSKRLIQVRGHAYVEDCQQPLGLVPAIDARGQFLYCYKILFRNLQSLD